MAKNQQLVLAFFENRAAADSAVKQLQEWDKAIAGIKFDSIGVLYKDDKGKVKAQMEGGRRTGLGVLLGALAAVLTGGVSLIAGVVLGGVVGHFVQKNMGLSKDDLARLSSELDGGKAAVGVLVPEQEAAAVTSWVTSLGGKFETITVSEETVQEAATLPEEPETTGDAAPAASAPDMPPAAS